MRQHDQAAYAGLALMLYALFGPLVAGAALVVAAVVLAIVHVIVTTDADLDDVTALLTDVVNRAT